MSAPAAPSAFPFFGHRTLAEVARDERWERNYRLPVTMAPDGTPLFAVPLASEKTYADS